MGWSCRADAGRTMRAWTVACSATTGSSNVFKDNGSEYFWEVSWIEHGDGAITGTVYRNLPPGPDGKCYCRKSESFRINPDGTVGRAPAFLKAVKVPADSTVYLPGSGGGW